MADQDRDRRVVLDRATRMLRQSQILRQMADELLEEARDLKDSVKRNPAGLRRAGNPPPS